MICLNNTDTLEGGASVNNVVDYTVHGLVNQQFTQIARGQLSNTNPSIIYTAAAAISIVSITLVNTHTDAVTVDLYIDPLNAGTPRRIIPKTLSLGVGYSMYFDGARCTVMNTEGEVITSSGITYPGEGIPVSSGSGWDTSLAASAESDFIMAGSSPFAWAKKTLAQAKTILNILLTSTAEAVGFTIAGGTSSKTLTVSDTTTLSGGTHSGTNTGDQDLSGYLLKSTYDANSILYATTDNTPVALTIAASRIVGRKSSGDIAALTGAEVLTLLSLSPSDNVAFNTIAGQLLGSASFNIADDAATSFTPTRPFGVILIYSLDYSKMVIGWYNAAAAYVTTGILAQSTSGAWEHTTGVLGGTTGTDGHFTFSAHTDGKIYLENRVGGASNFRYQLLMGGASLV